MDLSHSAWSDIFFLGMDYPEGARVLNVSIDLGVRGRDATTRPPVEAYFRLIDEPVLRLTSIDLATTADIADLSEVFDFARDYLGLLKAAVIAAGLFAFQFLRPKITRTTETAATSAPLTGSIAGMPVDQKSVAVLAFANLSDEKGNESFADSVSEELLNVLGKVRGLKVTARTSAFHFKGKDIPIPEIARQLGVQIELGRREDRGVPVQEIDDVRRQRAQVRRLRMRLPFGIGFGNPFDQCPCRRYFVVVLAEKSCGRLVEDSQVLL